MARPEGSTIQLPKNALFGEGAPKFSLTVQSFSERNRLRADASELSVCAECSQKPQLCHSPGVSGKNADNKMTIIAGKPVEVGKIPQREVHITGPGTVDKQTIEVVSFVPRRREGPVMLRIHQSSQCVIPKVTPHLPCPPTPPKPPGVK